MRYVLTSLVALLTTIIFAITSLFAQVTQSVPICADYQKREDVKLTQLDRTGKQFNGCSGDVSAFSDVYQKDGIRVSPGGGAGLIWYDFQVLKVNPEKVEFTWNDNAWYEADKAAYFFNWSKAAYDTVYTWRGKDGKEHITELPIDTGLYVNKNGILRVGFYGSPSSVIHIQRVRIL